MNTVALVGRPNVGKSTLFNKIVGKRISIVEDTPGVTRDRIYADANYNGYKFSLIDTGGIDVSNELFNEEIKIQANIAIDEADVVVFVVDGKEEINRNDYIIRDILMKSKKRVIVACNKMDNLKRMDNLYSFYELGFEEIIPVSGEHNVGITALLDAIVKDMNKNEDEGLNDNRIKFCLIGRPNVGKSSLVNAIVNEDKAIVSNVAGTTRDSVDTVFKYNGKEFVIIDTAGIRKSGKIYEAIEKYAVIRAFKATSRSDVCVIVINAEEGITTHDKHIAGYAKDSGKAVVIAVNKWDIGGKEYDINYYTKLIRNEFQFLPFAPIVFLSALTKKRIHTLIPEVEKAYENSCREIKTSVLNDVIRDAVLLNAPPSYKGKRLKVYFVHQTECKPPHFVFNVNNKNLVHFSYQRYLENKIRESFDLEGTPIIITFKSKGEE